MSRRTNYFTRLMLALRMLCFALLFSALSVNFVASLKVAHFEESPSGSEISSLILSNSSEVPLPDIFILCTSHQQSRMDNKGFYHIYGEDGQPWMSTHFETVSGTHNSVGLWGTFGGMWIYFGKITEPKLFFWYHICQKVDTSQGRISVSVNGHQRATNISAENLKRNKPRVLGGRIVVGKATQVSTTKDPIDQQFLGSVSNVNIFSAGNLSIEVLSSNNTCNVEGDVLPWSSAFW